MTRLLAAQIHYLVLCRYESHRKYEHSPVREVTEQQPAGRWHQVVVHRVAIF
jgi:hypothetical protein